MPQTTTLLVPACFMLVQPIFLTTLQPRVLLPYQVYFPSLAEAADSGLPPVMIQPTMFLTPHYLTLVLLLAQEETHLLNQQFHPAEMEVVAVVAQGLS